MTSPRDAALSRALVGVLVRSLASALGPWPCTTEMDMIWIHTPAGGGSGIFQNVSDALVVWLQEADVTLQVLRQGVLRRFQTTEPDSIERVATAVAAYPWVAVDAPDGWMKFVNVHRVSEVRRVPIGSPSEETKLIFTAIFDKPNGEAQHVEVLAELTDPERVGLLCRQLEWIEARDAC